MVGQSFTVEQLSGRWAGIHIPKVGRVRFRLSRPLPNAARSCRVKHDHSGRWHVSFPGPQPPVSRRPTGAAVGLDRGVAVAVATSEGDLLQVPKLSLGQRRRMRLLRRRLARQVRGSNRSVRTRLAAARMRAKERNRRKDWIEKTSTRLVRANDVIVLERRYVPFGILSARLKLVRAENVQPGAKLLGEELLNLESPLNVDNFEGVAVQEDPNKGTIIYIVSDDNYNPFQRTLLLQFRLAIK